MTHRIRSIAILATTFGALAVAPPAVADRKPVNEGGDTRPCVTYQEMEVSYLGALQNRIRRVLDTPGRKVSKRAIERYGMADVVGVPESDVAVTPWRYREVRSYPLCPGEGDVFLVEFDKRNDRAVQMLYA